MVHVSVTVSSSSCGLTAETEEYVNENSFIGNSAVLKYSRLYVSTENRREATRCKELRSFNYFLLKVVGSTGYSHYCYCYWYSLLMSCSLQQHSHEPVLKGLCHVKSKFSHNFKTYHSLPSLYSPYR